MPCYHPLNGYRSRRLNSSGKRSITFSLHQGFQDQPVTVPCGQCIGCRLERSRQWAVRCLHEASLYPHNCFLTLTYDDKHLPQHGSLNVKHYQDFMKRLRFKYCRFGRKIRFFHCGEYGENFGRPHYHALIFNLDFKDKYHFKKSPAGEKLYRSPSLEKLWTYGHSSIGNVTFESAAYVARYVTKKITGEKAFDHYNEYDIWTGELLSERRPEYVTMSRRPGIGKEWFNKFNTDVFPSDEVIIRGKQCKPPKYYSAQYELLYPTDFQKIKFQRIIDAKKNAADNTYLRLRDRESVQQSKFTQLKRTIK